MKQANTTSELEDILTHFSRLAKMRSSSPDSWQVLLDSLLSWRDAAVVEARATERIEVSNAIKRQRENYKEDNLFSVDYQEGMSDAAVIAYDADKHGWFDEQGEYHAD